MSSREKDFHIRPPEVFTACVSFLRGVDAARVSKSFVSRSASLAMCLLHERADEVAQSGHVGKGYRPESFTAWPGFFCAPHDRSLTICAQSLIRTGRILRSLSPQLEQSLWAGRAVTGPHLMTSNSRKGIDELVGARGFEPPTPCAQGLDSRGINNLAKVSRNATTQHSCGFGARCAQTRITSE